MKKIKAVLAIVSSVYAGISAAAWPNDKPIEIIVGFAAGGGQDTMIRTMQPFLEKELDAKIVVLNKPGASGEIAYTTLAQSPADGYTYSTLSTPGYLTMQISRKVQFNPNNIVPVARIVADPTTLAVHQDSPYKSLGELVEKAKVDHKAITIGGSGVGTDDHLAIMLFQQAGIKFNYVPFVGGSDVVTALLGQHIVMGALGSFTLNAGNPLRAIAVLAPERHAELADAPTSHEQGIDVFMSSDRGIATHADVPQKIRQRFSEAIGTVMKNSDFQAKMKQLNLPLAYLSNEEWAPELVKQRDEYQAIWDKSPWVK